jgi:lipopolysaccharide export system permease protein
MYILTRYVVWEVLKLFLASLLALTIVVTPVMVVQEGLREGFPVGVMLRIMPFTLPIMLGITLPASMLFAVCSVFGRMTGANEIVALKSLGINPMVAVWPAIVLAAFLSLGTVWMYEIAATWCKPMVLRIGTESIEEIAYSKLQKDRSCDRAQFPLSIIVKRIDKPEKAGDPPKLIKPTITIKGPPKVTISAEEATLHTDWKERKLLIECSRGEFDFGGPRMSFYSTEHFSVPIPEPNMAQYHFHRDWVAMRKIPGLIEERQNTIDKDLVDIQGLEQLQAAQQAIGSPKAADAAGEIAIKKGEINRCQFDIRRLRAESYRRWANGFTCLCFALLGIPVAMYWRHADVLTNFFVCFLPILAIYYPLLMLSDDLSTSGKLPPFSFWTANVVLTIPAIALLRWTVKH